MQIKRLSQDRLQLESTRVYFLGRMRLQSDLELQL
jgi:hypothetical protein